MKIPRGVRLTGGNIAGMVAMTVAQQLVQIGMDHLRKAWEPGQDEPPPREPRATTYLNIYIYGLVDPRTNEVRYVGAAKNPWLRRSRHLSEARSPEKSTTPKAVWLRDLLSAGLEPQVLILAYTTRANWREVEEKWIRSFPNLTNSNGTRIEDPESEDDV
jgi:hypothetical protein